MIKTKSIKQNVSIKTTPHNVYEIIMDSKKHANLTGASASVSRKVGGKFSVYDGYATGENLELIADKKIVQSWCASDWPPNIYSKITFVFTPIKTGTKIVFTQTGIPAENAKSIADGWRDYYWTPMKEMLENAKS